ncbi:MAG TPA: ATP synthase F0 subunit C [Candidatus Dormibacteraeota bacterium]|nr:ATP synthase F0 subunit C [Candidatus Dormibacteraeota bacterium]
MTKKAWMWMLLAFVVLLVVAPVTFAQTGGPAVAGHTDWVDLAAAAGLGLAAAGCGLGQGRATAAACEASARNPGAAGPIRIAFFVGVALIESLTLYVFAIVFIK